MSVFRKECNNCKGSGKVATDFIPIRCGGCNRVVWDPSDGGDGDDCSCSDKGKYREDCRLCIGGGWVWKEEDVDRKIKPCFYETYQGKADRQRREWYPGWRVG